VRQYQATAESNLIGGSRRKKSSNQPSHGYRIILGRNENG
jgi:hypothetical protein